jgi:hypothetical protein
MTANAVIKDASILGPVASLTGTAYLLANGQPSKSAGAVRGVVRVATSTTRVDETLPAVTDVPGNSSNQAKRPLQAKFLRIKNESALSSLEFAFGVGSAPAITYGAIATFAAGNAAAAWRLAPLEVIDVIVPPDATHLSHIQETGAVASTVAFYCSEGNVGDK